MTWKCVLWYFLLLCFIFSTICYVFLWYYVHDDKRKKKERACPRRTMMAFFCFQIIRLKSSLRYSYYRLEIDTIRPINFGLFRLYMGWSVDLYLWYFLIIIIRKMGSRAECHVTSFSFFFIICSVCVCDIVFIMTKQEALRCDLFLFSKHYSTQSIFLFVLFSDLKTRIMKKLQHIICIN